MLAMRERVSSGPLTQSAAVFAADILAIEAEARATVPDAVPPALPAGHPDTWPGGTMHMRAEPPALDVERLAEAMVRSDGVKWPRAWVRNDTHQFSWVARQVAAEYARLAREGSDGA